MMTLTEKVAYLKGLADGMKLDKEQDVNKLIFNIIDILDEVSLSIEDLDDNQLAIGDELDALSDDLAAIEEVVYDEDDDDDDDDDDWDWDENEVVYDVECPNCGEEITVDEDMLAEGSIKCPGCGEKLEFDICDCDCDECKEDGCDGGDDD